MPPLQGVILDKDGTLFDFQATWGAWARGLVADESRGDPDLARRLAAVLGYDLGLGRFQPHSIAVASTTEAVAEALLPFLPWHTKAGLMARMDRRSAEVPQVEVAPLREVLGRLKAMGLRLGVATNDSERPARAHVAGILDLLDFVAGFDSGWGAKPGAGQLLAFARAAGLEPGACAMVGDSLHDLAAARAAGMVGVGVLTGPAGRAALEPEAEVVLESLADLPGWIEARDGARGGWPSATGLVVEGWPGGRPRP